MDKEKPLQDEAINISHKQLSFFKPRHGYEPDSNIIQCMMNFAKSDIVKEYHNTDKKYTEEDIRKVIDETIKACNISQKESYGDLEIDTDKIINSLNKQD